MLYKGKDENDTEYSDSRKGWVPIWEEITLPKLNNGDGGNDGEGDKDHAGDDYNGVQAIHSMKLCLFFSNFQNQN